MLFKKPVKGKKTLERVNLNVGKESKKVVPEQGNKKSGVPPRARVKSRI